jgi:hypothetical protein
MNIKTLVLAFIRMTSVFLAKVVTVMEQHKMYGGGGERRLSEEEGDLRLLCLLIFVWCHDGLHLAFTFQALLHEMVSLKEMID